jgi:predicted ATPase/class 3 adenylate cyclase
MLELEGYTDLKTLHRGSRSLLVRGRRSSDGGLVVIKTPAPAFPSAGDFGRLRREFELSQSTQFRAASAHVVEHLALERFGSKLALVLRHSGVSVRETGEPAQRPIDWVLDRAVGIARAVQGLHEASILHLDINPTNILYDAATGQVRLCDLSAAALLGPGARAVEALPHRNPVYAAPERAGRSHAPVDARSDLYSLGVTLFELLTGRLPFSGEDALELMHRHLAVAVPSPRDFRADVPDAVARIVMRLLAKSADDRYWTARGLHADLVCCREQLAAPLGRAFVFGDQDVPAHLSLPRRLLGRQRELDMLQAALERAVAGERVVTLIGGDAGVGKSALVKRLRELVIARGGQVFAGKFEALRSNVPYHAVSEALQSAIQHALRQPEGEVQRWRDRLRAELGSNLQELQRVVPSLEPLLGADPRTLPLGPEQAQARFNHMLQSLIRAMAVLSRPLVLFLDDVHWADPASSVLIRQLLESDQLSHLLLVMAHRTDRAAGQLPNLGSFDSAERSTVRIDLGPLEVEDVRSFVAECLSVSRASIEPVAELLWRKTGGNPFFMRQFITLIHAEGLLWFDSAGGWRWDLAAAEKQCMTDNVVALVTRRVHGLAPELQQVLRLASCMGNEVAVGALERLMDDNARAGLHALLREALRQDLLVPVDGANAATEATRRLRFAHDHLQQAAYALIPDSERRQLHLALGRLLVATPAAERAEGWAFHAADHLLQAVPLILDSGERLRLVELCLAAGIRAKSANAYEAARRYLRAGLELLGVNAFHDAHDVAHALHCEYAECCYLSGELAEMAVSCTAVIEHGRTLVSKVRAYELQVVAHIARHEMAEAITMGRAILAELGVVLPAAPTRASAVRAVLRTSWRMRSQTEASVLARPRMVEPHHLAAMRLLSLLATPAYLTSPNLLPCLVAEALALAFGHGTSEWAADALLTWSAIQVAIGAPAEGYRMGMAAERLIDAVGAVGLRARVKTNFNLLVRHAVEPLRNTIEPLRVAADEAQRYGDLTSASVAAVTAGFYMLAAGYPLSEVEAAAIANDKLMARLGQARFVRDARRLLQLVHCLQGKAAAPQYLRGELFDDRLAMSDNRASGDRAGIAALSYERALLEYLHGDPAAGLERCEECREHLDSLLGTVYPPALELLSALSCARVASREINPRWRSSYLARMRSSLKRLKRWARSSPQNHTHRVHLVQAELERLAGRAARAAREYERAIDVAGQCGYLHEQAMALESAGRFYAARGEVRLANATLFAAQSAFVSWGATFKAAALEAEMLTADGAAPKLLHYSAAPPALAASVASTDLDAGSILKASQSIVSVLRLPDLAGRLLLLAMENTGAQRGFLLVNHAGELRVEAGIDVDGDPLVAAARSLPAERRGELLPSSIVEYVARVLELVVHADLCADPSFGHDAYVASVRPRSVLCSPLVSQGALAGMVYLENNRLSGAFSPERVEVLQVLASVAAISLENARLYSNLAEAHERQLHVSNAQARFVPAEFLSSLRCDSIVDVSLGCNIRKEMSVLFSDVRGFTRLVESMPAEEHIGFINSYLGRMEPAILESGGFVDSYLGDAIMALFEGDADSAIHAGVRMSQELVRLNRERERAGLTAIEMGVGVSTGQLTLGTIGGAQRLKCGVIGDPVNLASRVESLTKLLRCCMLLTHHTQERLRAASTFELRRVGRVRVKGKLAPIQLFEVIDAEPHGRAEGKRRTKAHFEDGLNAYEAGQFEAAERRFCECLQACPEDGAAAVLAARARHYRLERPKLWEGIDTLDEK